MTKLVFIFYFDETIRFCKFHVLYNMLRDVASILKLNIFKRS